MNITVNGKKTEAAQVVSVADILAQNNANPDMVAVQVNGEFVDKSNFVEHVLKENDEVDFLYFLGGGQEKLAFGSSAVHGNRKLKEPRQSLRVPVYDSAAFEFDSAEQMDDAFKGRLHAHAYSRISNPTVEFLEESLRESSGARSVTSFNTGMAAISSTVMALAGSGDNAVVSRHLFGHTLSYFDQTMRNWGLNSRLTDMQNLEQVEKNIDEKTAFIFLESVTNPQLAVADFSALADLAARHAVPLVVDTTMVPAPLFSARDWGVNIEVVSGTKAMSGGATSLAGYVYDHGNYNWSKNFRFADSARRLGPLAFSARLKGAIRRNTGAILSPHNAYLQTLGLETLALRLQKATENTLAIARYLQEKADNHQAASVHYPGLSSSPYFSRAEKYFAGQPGAVLTFTLESKEAAFSFMNALSLIRRATNLHDNKTLIVHPASTILADYSSQEAEAMGVSAGMLRLAVGIEDSRDLIFDLEQAFVASRNHN